MSIFTNKLSPQSRVWVYPAHRSFTAAEAEKVSERIADFVKGWNSHKVEVMGDGKLVHQRFVILMADESYPEGSGAVSGCSIDSSVRLIKALEKEFDIRFFDRSLVTYRDGDEIKSCSIADFELFISSGVLSENTLVFNHLANTKNELLSAWEIPYKDSWVKKVPALTSSFQFSL
jgi:hypothetical protein